MEFFLNFFIFACTFIILSQGYNLVIGYTGLVHIGHIAFMAMGAYTSSLLTLAGVSFWISVLLGILFPAVMGFILGFPTVRFREDYLAIATLAFAETVRSILINWKSVTEGALGLPGIPRPSFFGYELDTLPEYFLFVVIITILVNLFIYRITHSPFGRVLETIREDELASLALGKNITKYKVTALTIGAALAGLAGILNAHFTTYIDPFLFGLDRMAFVLLIVMLGGAGRFWGPIVATFVLYGIFEGLRFVPLPSAVLGALRWIIFGLALTTIMVLKPTGLLGKKLLKKKY